MIRVTNLAMAGCIAIIIFIFHLHLRPHPIISCDACQKLVTGCREVELFLANVPPLSTVPAVAVEVPAKVCDNCNSKSTCRSTKCDSRRTNCNCRCTHKSPAIPIEKYQHNQYQKKNWFRITFHP